MLAPLPGRLVALFDKMVAEKRAARRAEVPPACTDRGSLLAPDRLRRLHLLHEDIDRCRICESVVPDLRKPLGVNRGSPGRVIIVGEAPAAQEQAQGKAFAGQAGKRLDQWLIACGQPPDDARRSIYLTSVVKCRNAPAQFNKMVRNCRHFIDEQVRIIAPRIVITLGKHAYDAFAVSRHSYDDALCTIISTSEHVLTTPSGPHYILVPWPHPSGMNRWHNEPRNRTRLTKSFQDVAPLLTR